MSQQKQSYRVYKWSFPRRSFFRVVQGVITTVLPKLFSYEANGIEHLRALSTQDPIIMAGNHRSHLDALILGISALPPRGTRKFFATITPGTAAKMSLLERLVS